MNGNDLYRRMRFRVGDPLRDHHVPRRHRLDVDDESRTGSLKPGDADDMATPSETPEDVTPDGDPD